MTTTKKMRERVLRERGVNLEHSRLNVKLVSSNGGKTPTMLLLELRFNDDIKSLLSEGSVRDVAKRLGINYSTVSKWRKSLGL